MRPLIPARENDMMKRMVRSWSWLACLALLAACGGKLTNANLLKVKNGMSEARVRELLGKPAQIKTGEVLNIRGTTYLYEKGRNKVQVIFINDAVINKSGSFE
jgi:hypothetical protein